jgi:formimidoylglutamate deiminase
MKALFTHDALLPDGWARNVRIELAPDGTVAAVHADTHQDGAQPVHGPVIPGMPNLHSHAFQRAMAGMTEVRGSAEDSFWTWRETMYAFAGRVTPEDAYTIAAQVYVELARSGYTAVAEFHYLHHDPDGAPYPRPAEMALAHVRAARDAGIGITLLPVVYTAGGFGPQPLGLRQRRFAATVDACLEIAAAVRAEHAADPDVATGLALHSLRGATPDDVRALAAASATTSGPIHIHVAEQQREVDDCLAWSGRRPIEWLLENAPVDERWCLVHATHATDAELAEIARRGSVAGLCPSTEANLGDGVFPLGDFLAHGGRIGIGSDSNVSRSPVEELRWLEYGQRLVHRRRNVVASADAPRVGERLWALAGAGGAQALGRPTAAIAPGHRADLVVLDAGRSAFAGLAREQWLDALVFSGSEQLVKDVMVGGRWTVRDHRHPMQDGSAARFKRVVERLRS